MPKPLTPLTQAERREVAWVKDAIAKALREIREAERDG